jgi:aldehyde dehydrogenase (NAD+)
MTERNTSVSPLPSTDELATRTRSAFDRLGAPWPEGTEAARSPIAGGAIASVTLNSPADVDAAVERATEAFATWRDTPAPVRGELVRVFGQMLRANKEALAEIVTLEAGKIRSEALGEVQEMIDMCDFAVGVSRQLYGLTIASERPGHRMMESWHPLGVCGVITAFNFPVAVWSWNAALALVCGDPVVWKPSDRTPLTALACQAIFDRAAEQVSAPPHLSQVVLGGADVGSALVDHPGVALLSATGSTRMGEHVAPRVAARFGRCLLELGGNNAAVVAPTADLELAARGIVFSAAGTAGQRCTTLRRLIVHADVHDEIVDRLARVYGTLAIGDPFDDATLVGPLIGRDAFDSMSAALDAARGDGGTVVAGGSRVRETDAPDAFYVEPAIVTMPAQTDIVVRETFAPLLYVMSYDDFDEAISLHNATRYGLSSAIFTNDLREAEAFVSAAGSDCGIANVNIGPSGAEIGGAFGGEKATGGGREAGSDAWRAYMRRMTTTVNRTSTLPLAQGVRFV